MCGKRLDLAGIQLGHLTVLEATDHRSSQGSIIWRCRCDCGNEILLPSSSIRNSHIADCGCYYLLFKTGTIRKAYGELIPIGFPCY